MFPAGCVGEFAKDLVIWDLSYQDPFSDVYYDSGVILDECVHRITTVE